MTMSKDDQLKLARRIMLYEMGSSIIYAAQMGEGGPVKIGKTKDLDARIQSLQTGSPHEIMILVFVVAPDEIEKQLHAYLDEFRMNGEWFKPSKEVLETVEIIRSTGIDALLDKFEERIRNNSLTK